MSKESAQIIKNFLYENDLTIAQFAKIVDLCRWTIYKYLNGGNIQPKVARRMERLTTSGYKISLKSKKLLQ